MKVLTYSYREGDHLRFLYVNMDFDSSKLPSKAKKIIEENDSKEICWQRLLVPDEVAVLKSEGCLFAPEVVTVDYMQFDEFHRDRLASVGRGRDENK